MNTKVGIGYSENADSHAAGMEAARMALASGQLDQPHLVLLFATSKHNPTQLRDGVRAVIGSGPRLIGGYAVGIITKDYLGYAGYQVGVAVLKSDSSSVDTFIETGLPDREGDVGAALAKQVNSRDYRGERNLIVMYDSVKRSAQQGIALNHATELIGGMTSVLGTWPRAVGIGFMGDVQFNQTHQWFDDRVEQGSAMALMLSGDLRMDTVTMHGCKPSSSYHMITKAAGAAILEIDGKPALDAIAELLDPTFSKSVKEWPFFLTLGVNHGDKFGEFNEEEYSNRVCMGVDENSRAVVLAEPDLKEGSEFQLMRRTFDFDSIRHRAEALYSSLKGRKPVFALYIDCCGRAGAFCGTDSEDAAVVQEVIGSKMPLFGLYSGWELAKVGAREMQPLDWTGVLCIFSEPA